MRNGEILRRGVNKEINGEPEREQERTDREQVEKEPFQALHSQSQSTDPVRNKVTRKGEKGEPPEKIGIGDQRARTDEPERNQETEDPDRHERSGP